MLERLNLLRPIIHSSEGQQQICGERAEIHQSKVICQSSIHAMDRVNQLRTHLISGTGSSNRSSLRELRLSPNEIRKAFGSQEAEFDLKAMKHWLENDNHQMRDELREFLKDEIFEQNYHLTLDQLRELALLRLKKLCAQPGRFFSVRDFQTNPCRIFAAHEIACLVDGSLATKITVMMNLFGGTVLKLGTELHHRELLDKIDAVEQIGCFALTELGYGNNAIEMETTATYNHEKRVFVINTPTTLAQKYWITNAALHAHWCIVFAQTLVKGKNEGVQAFLVRIRDNDGVVSMGVTIEDMGRKMGQNGVDNGKLSFRNVEVPKTALLNSVSDIDENGHLVSEIKSRRGRFLVALNQLLSGRLCLASKAVGRTKQALTIAVRYASTRLCVGESGKSDTPIMSYQLQQRALLPLIARTYVLSGHGMNYVKHRYSQESTANGLGTAPLSPELNVLCSGIKAMVTWHCERTATICRERCGGQGYLAANRFEEILGDAHAICTAEGDNRVLMQKVAKEVLSWYRSGLRKLPVVGEEFAGFKDFHNLLYLRYLFAQREGVFAVQLQGSMDRDMKAGASLFEVWMMRQSDHVQGLARAYVERVCLEQMAIAIDKAGQGIATTLEQVAILFCLDAIESDIGFFLSNRIIPPENANNFYFALRQLCSNKEGGLASISLRLVEAFAIPDHLLPPCARDWVKYNEIDNNGEIKGIEF